MAKVVISIAIVGAGLGALGGGIFAAFTTTASGGPTPITTGVVNVTLGAGTLHGLLTQAVSNMAEGDTAQRAVILTNSSTDTNTASTTGLATTNGLTLQTAVSGTNAANTIVTDTTNGLQVRVATCTVAGLVEAGGTTGPWTYTCSDSGGFKYVGIGTSSTYVPLNSLDTAATDITSSAPAGNGGTIAYVMTVELPTTYADSYSLNGGTCGGSGGTEQLQGCSLSVAWNLTATQRTAAND